MTRKDNKLQQIYLKKLNKTHGKINVENIQWN